MSMSLKYEPGSEALHMQDCSMMGLSVLHHSVFLQKWGSVELLKVLPTENSYPDPSG